MHISLLLGTLVPVFFVLALGYFAGKRNTFDVCQAAALSKLAMSFALPAALFVGMTNIRRELLLQQGRLFLALILAHVGLFVVAWIVLRRIKSLRGTPSVIHSLVLATSGSPVFGLAILEPILGATSAGAVGLVALAVYLTVALAVVFLEVDAATKYRQTGSDCSKPSPVITGLQGALKSPLLWGPVLGMAVVLAKVHLPSLVTNSLDLIGSATSGVALFSAGLVLAAYPVRLAPGVFAGSLARVAVQSANADGSTSSTLGQKPILTRSPGVLQPSRRTYDRAFCKPIQVRPIRDRVDAFDLNPRVDYYGPSNTLDH